MPRTLVFILAASLLVACDPESIDSGTQVGEGGDCLGGGVSVGLYVDNQYVNGVVEHNVGPLTPVTCIGRCFLEGGTPEGSPYTVTATFEDSSETQSLTVLEENWNPPLGNCVGFYESELNFHL